MPILTSQAGSSTCDTATGNPCAASRDAAPAVSIEDPDRGDRHRSRKSPAIAGRGGAELRARGRRLISYGLWCADRRESPALCRPRSSRDTAVRLTLVVPHACIGCILVNLLPLPALFAARLANERSGTMLTISAPATMVTGGVCLYMAGAPGLCGRGRAPSPDVGCRARGTHAA
jgi:hypothetical protein